MGPRFKGAFSATLNINGEAVTIAGEACSHDYQELIELMEADMQEACEEQGFPSPDEMAESLVNLTMTVTTQ